MPRPARLAFLAALAACASAETDRLAGHVAFIEAASGLRDPGRPRPEVRWTGPAAIARHSGATALDGSAPVGIFVAEANLILLRHGAGEDVLVHELTHWLLHAAGVGPGCAAEREAYRVQALWRARHGLPAGVRSDACDAGAYPELAQAVAEELARRR